MLKQLAAIGIGAALILAPVASFAQTATPTPAATATPMMKKVVKHHVVKKPMMVKKPMVKHHVVKHHMVKKPMAKKPMPAPTPTKS
jgi:pentapeptide MXKDX repeat protein